MTKAVELAQVASTGVSEAFKNRIINGAMVIDQRNAGASYSTNTLASANLYTLDRWFFAGSQNSKFTVQQSSDAPSGFSNSMLITSSSAYTVTGADFFILQQAIEGFNTADLNFGTANAKTVTLSFWVKSSLTGNFGAALQNNGYGRSYPFSYTINSANTWEQKSVTVVGDTTGTWVGATNGVGLRATFSIGCAGNTGGGNAWVGANFFQPAGSTSVVGTNGATFYITGVQLEVGSSATSFEYRSYTTELQLCQRYYTTSPGTLFMSGYGTTPGTNCCTNVYLPVQMRASPTVTLGSFSNASGGGSGNINVLSFTVDAQTSNTFAPRFAGYTAASEL